MWEFIYILVLFGQCLTMQPGLEYQYRYSGRLATGIMDMRHQFAAIGIQADVTVQVEEDYTFLIQFQNVETGDFHEDLACDHVKPLSITYNAIQEGADLLHKPFRITMNGTENIGSLEVPLEEPQWITNVRKSVIDVFPLAALWREIQGSGGQRFLRPNFGAKDDLIGGHCMNWYTVTKLPDDEVAKEEQVRKLLMEEDVQHGESSSTSGTSSKGSAKMSAKGSSKGRGRKGSKFSKGSHPSPSPSQYSTIVPSIDDTLWNVVRVIDYDTCEDGIVTLKRNGPKDSDQLVSRTSIANYLLRGDQRGIRVEMAMVEGAISLFTSSKQEDHIDTFSNQTVELKAVRRITRKLTIDYEIKRTDHWYFEVDHSSGDGVDGMHTSVEEVLTGIYLTEDDFSEMKTAIRDHLEVLLNKPPNLAAGMKKLSDAIGYLSYEHVADIFEEAFEEQSRLSFSVNWTQWQKVHQNVDNIQMALIMSGSEATLTFMLEKMTDDNFRLQNQKSLAMLFKNLQTSIKNPVIVPKILDLAIALPWEQYGGATKSIALTAAASIARKSCFSPERRTTYTDATCDPGYICNTSAIVNTFLPYLQDVLEDGSSPLWQRMVSLQALSNLGTPQTLEILTPIILGTKDSHLSLRTIAIMSLTSNMMHPSALGLVYNLLMPLMENKGEHVQIRSMAFLVMSSWNPGPTWWKHMAISTWHESSSQLANLISSSIHAIANSDNEMSKSVSRVLHLAKPAAPVSLTHSSMTYLLDFVHSKDFIREIGLIWFASTEGLVPSHLSIKLIFQVLYGFPSAFKLVLQQRHMSRLIMLFLGQPSSTSKTGESYDIVQDMIKEKLEQLGVELPGLTSEVNFWLSSDDIMHFAHNFELPELPAIHLYLVKELLPLFYNTVDSTMAFPTDLGIPLLIKHSVQSAARLQFENARPPSDFPSNVPSGTALIDLQVSYSAYINMKTLVPWSKKSAIGTDLRTDLDFKLPVAVHSALKSETHQLFLRLQPLSQERDYMVVHAFNCPHTIQYGSFPPSTMSTDTHYQQINRNDDDSYSRKDHLMTGLWGSWKAADIELPTLSNIIRGDFLPLTPTHNTWEYQLTFHPPSSDFSLSSIFTYVAADLGARQEVTVEEDLTEFGQESQSSVDYSDFSQLSQSASQDYSQLSQSASQDYSEFSQSQGDILEVDPLGFQEAQLSASQLHERMNITSGSYTILFTSFKLEIYPSVIESYPPPVDYTLGVLLADESLTENSKSQVTVAVEMDSLAIETAGLHKTCFKVTLEKPDFLPFTTTEEVLTTDLTKDVKGQLYFGHNCRQTPILQFQGTLVVSENQKNHVRDKVERGCDYNPDDPAPDIITSQLYDHAHFKASWTDKVPLPWLNQTYQMYDVIRGNLFHSLSFDYTTRNPDHTIDIDATKNLMTNHWTVRTAKSHEVSFFDVVGLLPAFIGTPAKTEIFFIHNSLNGRRLPYCIINEAKVHTFDGEEFPFAADSCWRIAALDCLSGRAMFQVRHSDEWEAQVLWGEEGLLFHITNSQVTVNGESPDDANDNRYKIIHLDGAILVRFSTSAAIKVSNKVEIYSPPKLRSLPCGLCGNFDGEKTSDMVGPKGCVYTDPELYSYSWSVSGDGCNAFRLRSHKRKVEEYMSECTKKSNIPTGVSHNNMHNQCMKWEYQERREGNYKCTAIIPTPKCNSGCVPTYTTQEPIMYDCVAAEAYQMNGTSECHPHTYITTFPADCKQV